MFLKEKRRGTIKSHGCADGPKQRLHKTKEETSSPALNIKAFWTEQYWRSFYAWNAPTVSLLQSLDGKKVLYKQLDKALYGAVQRALLFWKKLPTFVVDTLGFEINRYDACVANKIVNSKPCTIAWYMDDLKLSHEDPAVFKDIFVKLQAKFGNEAPLPVTCGKVHNYLGMRIDYSIDAKVQLQCRPWWKKLLHSSQHQWHLACHTGG
ncbi:reverse transcriptase RNA-dependent DNA polymerase [Nitzschia inconspicua]|uniref:Reverse transcriptase RNA-dependent DNA polymerase n=1 Tax=Nitzschia inconspicua TaxID=303405 RepID=A0A9K3KYK2_9STRA|nr:reverse transcriptase RNA-dependent DNA polymerase [Nitzschia inconspicua]